MSQHFSQDFTTPNVDNWRQWLRRFAGVPNIRALEVGCYEGRSSLWFLENILDQESSFLTCIDPHCPPVFSENIRRYQHKVSWVDKPSCIALRDASLRMESFHFAYIDGDHSAPRVLEDAVLILPLLVAGGVLIFDDYLWKSKWPDVAQSMPKMAIDAFLSVFAAQIQIVHRGCQICVKKLPARPLGLLSGCGGMVTPGRPRAST